MVTGNLNIEQHIRLTVRLWSSFLSLPKICSKPAQIFSFSFSKIRKFKGFFPFFWRGNTYCVINAMTMSITAVWLLSEDYFVSMVSSFLALVSLVFNLCQVLRFSGCCPPPALFQQAPLFLIPSVPVLQRTMNRIRIHVLPTSRNRVAQTLRPEEPQTCTFAQRPCSLPRLDGLEFCIKHILEDKNAPYKQCNYVSTKNGKRCPNASPKGDRKDGWVEHLPRLRCDADKQLMCEFCSPE